METFIITFSRANIRDGWVAVEAKDEAIARAWAYREYGNLWSMIYPLADWGDEAKAHFPLGQFGPTIPLHYEQAQHV